MAEPQPSTVSEGAADPHSPTSTAEDRKTAAALSTLDAQDEAGEKKDVNSKALHKAMEGLSVKDKKKVDKAAKVEAGDVALLVRGLLYEIGTLGEGTEQSCCCRNIEADWEP